MTLHPPRRTRPRWACSTKYSAASSYVKLCLTTGRRPNSHDDVTLNSQSIYSNMSRILPSRVKLTKLVRALTSSARNKTYVDRGPSWRGSSQHASHNEATHARSLPRDTYPWIPRGRVPQQQQQRAFSDEALFFVTSYQILHSNTHDAIYFSCHGYKGHVM